jgi:hypothetical protein
MYKIYNRDQLQVFRVFMFTREHRELGRKPMTIHQTSAMASSEGSSWRRSM